jgi:outer membrane protein OmpA-like peptidoglycan-associated protein
MKGQSANLAGRAIFIALTCGLVLLVNGTLVAALSQDQPTESQILEALKARGPARAVVNSPAERERAAQERRFIEALLKKTPRAITVEERRKVAEIVSEKPSIDLEVTFEYNSAVVGPQAVPPLVTLGRALADADLKEATFLIAGHTDAKGSESYNQGLSERRAEAVKGFLVEQFKLPPDHLLAIGHGKEQLKDKADPFAAVNRRVQVVNMLEQ